MKGLAVGGGALVVLYTLVISSADAITKQLATGYAAPQLFVISGLVVVFLTLLANRVTPNSGGLRTICPRAMALRAGATVLACSAFFYAFRLLPFAEVFIFIGMMPLFAALMSGPILGERASLASWAALVAGLLGMICLFPNGLPGISLGHGMALLASLAGTFSIILSRYIGSFEKNSLAQVLYPNLAILVVMAIAAPFVWKPMALTDFGWAVLYAGLLFIGRWVLVIALRRLAAYAVTTLMKLQFVWMVILGAVFFGEWPASNVYLGVAIVIGSGVFLVYDQQICKDGTRTKQTPIRARVRTFKWVSFVR